MRKQIAILISTVFMVSLMSSSLVSSVSVAGTATQNDRDSRDSVSVSPPVARVQQNELATFDVKVVRGSDLGPFSGHLSLVSDSSILKAAVSFDPPVLNFREGQIAANSTMKVNSQELGVGTTAFRVQTAPQSQSPAISDKALSNPATIVVRAAEPGSQSLTTSESIPTERTPEPTPSKLNYPPIAKAGQDQVIKEGERGVLDGSSSTDRDKDALSFSWQQISPKQPIIKLYPSDASSKVSFLPPDVNRDTMFKFNLLVKDTNGAQAVDSINVLTKNVEASESGPPAAALPKPEEVQEQNQEKPTSQETAPDADTTASPTSNQVPTSTNAVNHSPTAEAQQALLTGEGKPLTITLNGNDADKGDKISYVILSNPTHGTIAGFDKTAGVLTYMPTSGFVGQDKLTYKVIDNHDGESNAGVVVIRVRAANLPQALPSSTDSTLDNSSSTSTTSPSESSLSPSSESNENATSATLGALALDETPPLVVLLHPQNLSTNVPINIVITATFNEPVDATTVNVDTFELFFVDTIDGGLVPVTGTVSLSTDGITATFKPDANLFTNSAYVARVNDICDECTGIKDLAGNEMETGYPWTFETGTTSDAELTMTLDPPSQKWGHEITAHITPSGALEDDKITVDWADGTPVTEILSVTDGVEVTATHVYGKPEATTDLVKLVVAKLLSSDGEEGEIERASTEVSTTIQKHETSLSLEMKPSPELDVCTNCVFTASGKLTDLNPVPEPEPEPDIDVSLAATTSATTSSDPDISGKTITFSGSGASTLNPVTTEGLTFTGVPYNDLELTSSALRMHVGSQIDLSYSGVSASGITALFSGGSGSPVGVTLTKAVAPFDTVSMTIPVGSPQNADFAKGFSKLTITSVGGSSSPSAYADLKTFTTRYIQVSPQEQFDIDFSNIVPDPGTYSELELFPSYFEAGVTQNADANGLKIKAQFDGTSDPAYLGATSQEISYDVDSSAAGVGNGDVTSDTTTVWTKLTVGDPASPADVCTFNGVIGADNDKDNICDRWENNDLNNDITKESPGNDGTHRYVVCPSKAGFAGAIDPNCTSIGQNPSIKYNLCNPLCPTVGKKDIYVEIDSKQGFVLDNTAISRVVNAFAKAPVAIALHVTRDETISDGASGIPANFFVWRDPAENPVVGPNFDDGNPNNDFFNVKKVRFGTPTERSGAALTCTPTPCTASAWTSTGDTMKHYFARYGMSVNFYSKTVGLACPAAGTSSGVGEVLGNDFVISLGCRWGTFDTSPRSIAQQAGTFMHELGHNIGLHHGGPATAVSGRTQDDYSMNCKPNYLSVMNYARQMPWDLVSPFSTTTPALPGTEDINRWQGDLLGDLTYNYGSGAGFNTFLDYSRTDLPDQPESALREDLGTLAPDGNDYRIIYLKTSPNPDVIALATDGKPFDLNGDGSTTAAATGDINALGSKVAGCGPLSPQTEKSYNDWNEINLVFLQDSQSQDGVTRTISDPFSGLLEVTPAFAIETRAKASALQVQFIPPPNTDGSTTFNIGANVPAKFSLKGTDNQPIRNAKVTFVAEKGTTRIVGLFTYNLAKDIYQFDWKTPATGQARGQWTISYFKDYQTPNQVLLQGPEAQALGGLYTYKITGK